jgi:hypothetical protein
LETARERVAELEKQSDAAEKTRSERERLASDLTVARAARARLEGRVSTLEAELATLKRAPVLKEPDSVQDIYARAHAELNAVKNELLRRPKPGIGASAVSPPKPDEPG